MMIAQDDTLPGLSSGPGWREIGYFTGDSDWPHARVRIVPIVNDDPRQMSPNAPALPARIAVRLSASLVDGEGQVLRINGRLLLGPETVHTWQFNPGIEFDGNVWLDGLVAAVIDQLLTWARGVSAAAALGFVPAADID